MRVKKWPGRRGAAAINQELIQSCEMPRLINLCQHFLRCWARSLVSPLPSLSPLSLAQRRAPSSMVTRRRKWNLRANSPRLAVSAVFHRTYRRGEKREPAFAITQAAAQKNVCLLCAWECHSRVPLDANRGRPNFHSHCRRLDGFHGGKTHFCV